MGTPTGLDAEDAVRCQRLRPNQGLGVFTRIDVVGDHGDRPVVTGGLAQLLDQCGLAGPDGTADSDAQRAVSFDHERKSLG